MTELKEELKAREGEEPVEYAERVGAVLEEHRPKTGERLSVHNTMPGEGPGEVLECTKVLNQAEGVRSAERARATAAPERTGRSTARRSSRSPELELPLA